MDHELPKDARILPVPPLDPQLAAALMNWSEAHLIMAKGFESLLAVYGNPMVIIKR